MSYWPPWVEYPVAVESCRTSFKVDTANKDTWYIVYFLNTPTDGDTDQVKISVQNKIILLKTLNEDSQKLINNLKEFLNHTASLEYLTRAVKQTILYTYASKQHRPLKETVVWFLSTLTQSKLLPVRHSLYCTTYCFTSSGKRDGGSQDTVRFSSSICSSIFGSFTCWPGRDKSVVSVNKKSK